MKKSKIKPEINFSNQENVHPHTQDEINLELSRTYFGGKKNRRTTPDRRNASDRRNNSFDRNPFKKNLYMPLAVLLLVLFATILFGLSFLYRNHNNVNSSNIINNYNSKTTPNVPDKEAALSKPVPMVSPLKSESGEAVLYNFEENADGWGIPAWALNLRDHVAISTEQSNKYSSNGNGSLRVNSKFPEKQWSASLVEIQHFLNFENFDIIAADVFFPSHDSKTLRGKLILTQGENWEFNEMSHSFRINPGEWTTIWANISENSVDWKKKKLDPFFKTDIRKIAIRIESTKSSYKGPVYIDNIRVYTKDKFDSSGYE